MGTCALPDIHALSPLACGPQASGIHIRQSTRAHVITYTSRLMVVSRAAKQSRTGDTTVCYIHERSILIERSPKADRKNQPYEKTTHDTKFVYNH